jgi:DNA primase
MQKEYLVETGLVIKKRASCPWIDLGDELFFQYEVWLAVVQGFGGRILSSTAKTAKYLNSPESEIYHKSQVLYGIF